MSKEIIIKFILSEEGQKVCFAKGLPANKQQTIKIGPSDPNFGLALRLCKMTSEGEAVLNVHHAWVSNHNVYLDVPHFDEIPKVEDMLRMYQIAIEKVREDHKSRKRSS